MAFPAGLKICRRKSCGFDPHPWAPFTVGNGAAMGQRNSVSNVKMGFGEGGSGHSNLEQSRLVADFNGS